MDEEQQPIQLQEGQTYLLGEIPLRIYRNKRDQVRLYSPQPDVVILIEQDRIDGQVHPTLLLLTDG